MTTVILDAGPWVDYLDKGSATHAWAVEQFSRYSRFVSCEAVLAEVCARLRY